MTDKISYLSEFYDKPAIVLIPKSEFKGTKSQRFKHVCDAVNSHIALGLYYPEAWLDEYIELLSGESD